MKYIISSTIFFISLLTGTITIADCINQNVRLELINPENIYDDGDNGAITDRRSSLEWKKCSIGQRGGGTSSVNDICDLSPPATLFTWFDALQAVMNFNVASTFNGIPGTWRLPNKNELASLIETGCYSPAINQKFFSTTPSADYWTSTPSAANNKEAWYANFDDGILTTGPKTGLKYVRLVRDR